MAPIIEPPVCTCWQSTWKMPHRPCPVHACWTGEGFLTTDWQFKNLTFKWWDEPKEVDALRPDEV